MDSRKILEIYKRLNDRSIKPVSAFPSVAAIPPGALVLDSDGVVMEKRFTVYMNGPDTLIFAPVASNIKDIDWEFSFGFRDDNPAQAVFARYVQFLAGSLPNFVLVANLASYVQQNSTKAKLATQTVHHR